MAPVAWCATGARPGGSSRMAGQHQALLRAVVDTALDGIMLIDGQDRVQMFNPACERLFGYRADEVIGQSVWMLLSAPDGGGREIVLGGDKSGAGKRRAAGRRRDGTTFAMD